MTKKKKILVFSDWYEPAYKAGGPIQSCVNFIENMIDDYEIYLVTGDRDLNEKLPFAGVTINEWIISRHGEQVIYCNQRKVDLGFIQSTIRKVSPDFIYLNSMFSYRFSILPLFASSLSKFKGKVVLSPRGMLKPSALQFKRRKKQAFLRFLKVAGAFKRVHFLSSDEEETRNIELQFPGAKVSYAPNFPAKMDPINLRPGKEKGKLKVLFIGRIHRIKQLHILLDALARIKGEVKLGIVGDVEDAVYWSQCSLIIDSLPKEIEVNYIGSLAHKEVKAMISNYHLFALPTKGENFGHAIFESLSKGLPVLISDQTPWLNLAEKNAGWDLPLDDINKFSHALQMAVNWDDEDYSKWSAGAAKIASQFIQDNDIKGMYLQVFN